MKVSIFGTGYVGLVTGICLAEIGHEVMCIDTDIDKIDRLNRGESPIYEPGLADLLTKNIAVKRITFVTDVISGVDYGDYIFIAVGTPASCDGSADLQYVFTVAKTIGENLNHNAIIINKSTVPVGTGDKVKTIIQKELSKRNLHIKFAMIANPEFLKQGDAIEDFMRSDRIIIGSDNKEALNKMNMLYEPLATKIVSMDIYSAELSKYAANAFLATKISFINEIAQFSEKFGADIEQVRLGIGSDARIGHNFLSAGCGYGGSCFPKDVSALIWMARKYGIESPFFNAVENINLRQKSLIFNLLKKYFGNLDGRVIALWGLSFKPNTDDMREAPSRVLLESLWKVGAKVQAYDPIAQVTAEKIYGKRLDLKLCTNRDEVLVNADVLVIITEWNEFRNPDFNAIKSNLRYQIIFDGRNLFDPVELNKLGIEYHCVGRANNFKKII
ncbi:MAG: UDP-glucose/GDP-mannose dehydrogenase family protein [Coxiellaceae bacterium]|jgi:UDPglucose 6-dehydrogenase|nr:UDP-glucose/GDP-mannose dehydrogenase family protein [Coxiellaceae bacterium]